MKFITCFAVSAVLMMALAAEGAEVPVNIQKILEGNASLGLGKFPIGFWNYTNLNDHAKYMDEAEVEEWADAGFTVTMSSSFDPAKPEQIRHMKKMLRWADRRGMKLILCDPRAYAPPGKVTEEYRKNIAAALADFKGTPGLFGFHIGDEPGANSNDFFEAYRMTRKMAPELHPFANLLPYWPGAEQHVGYPGWPEYLDAAVQKGHFEFLCWDCYAQMNPGTSGWNMYFENLRLNREAARRGGVPFWTTILSVGHFRYRTPNYDELRWQFNSAICSGASGILWFFYYMRQPHDNYRLSPVDENWDRTQTYYDIRRFQKAFHRHYGDLFLRLAPTRVTFYPEPFGRGKAFAPNEVVSAVRPDREGHPLLIGEFADKEGRRYAMLVNNSAAESVRAMMAFPGKDVKIYSWNWQGKEYEGGAYASGGLERTDSGIQAWHWLAPGQEVVYRVDSEQARNAKIVAE
ncbi:MAG: hypothetical protein IT210_07315 [Armatimonadetes bacterium]|nr:hypothetical protein [Armatimonadota bacterium]